MIDAQLAFGAIFTGLLLGWVAQETNLVGRIRKHIRAQRAWKQSRELGAPDPSCRRLGDEWRVAATDPNRSWM